MLDTLNLILNQTPLLSGIIMILMNIGGKYLSQEIPESADKVLGHPIVRKLIVFCFAFIATRDIKTAILLTLLFYVCFRFLFNDKSKVNILKKKDDKVEQKTNVTMEEVKNAQKIIDIYNQRLEDAKVRNKIN